MDSAIKILEQEYKWVEENRELCPHGDEYYDGYKEGVKNSLGLLKMAKQKEGHE